MTSYILMLRSSCCKKDRVHSNGDFLHNSMISYILMLISYGIMSVSHCFTHSIYVGKLRCIS